MALEQLEFGMDPPSGDIRQNSRTNVRLVHSDTYDPESSNLIRWRISGNSWVDMESIAMYATVTYNGTSNTTTTDAARCFKPSTGHLVDSIRWISGGGTVIEHSQDVATRYELLSRADGDKMYLDSTLNISAGGHSVPGSRPDLKATPKKLRIAALDVSAFVHCSKFIHLSSFEGSLELEMVLNSNARVFSTRGAATAFYQLTQCELRFDTLEVSDEYQSQIFNKTFSEGFSLPLLTYTVATSLTSGLSNVTLPLNKVLGDARSCNSVVRASSQFTNANQDFLSFQGCTALEYNYLIGSKRYPAFPVNSLSMCYQEFLKSTKNHKNSAHSPVIDTESWNLDQDSATALHATDIDNDNIGHTSYPIELELSDGPHSGTPMTSSDMLELNLTSTLGAGPFTVTTFIDHIREVAISQMGIVVRD